MFPCILISKSNCAFYQIMTCAYEVLNQTVSTNRISVTLQLLTVILHVCYSPTFNVQIKPAYLVSFGNRSPCGNKTWTFPVNLRKAVYCYYWLLLCIGNLKRAFASLTASWQHSDGRLGFPLILHELNSCLNLHLVSQ